MDTNVNLGLDLEFVPVPKNDCPVWCACQSNNELALILWCEAATQELLGLIVFAINVWIRKLLLLLLRMDIVNGASGPSRLLADSEVFFRF